MFNGYVSCINRKFVDKFLHHISKRLHCIRCGINSSQFLCSASSFYFSFWLMDVVMITFIWMGSTHLSASHVKDIEVRLLNDPWHYECYKFCIFYIAWTSQHLTFLWFGFVFKNIFNKMASGIWIQSLVFFDIINKQHIVFH